LSKENFKNFFKISSFQADINMYMLENAKKFCGTLPLNLLLWEPAALLIFAKPQAVCLFFRRTGSVYQLQKPRKGKRISFLQIFVVTMEFLHRSRITLS
jgi:hypothetical protein